MKILFWNLGKNNNGNFLVNCILEHAIDIAILAEFNNVCIPDVINNLDSKYTHIESNGGCEKITLIASTDVNAVIRREQTRYVLYSIKKNGFLFNLVGVHLQDRHNCDSSQRIAIAARLMNDLKNLEDSSKCKNSIVIGDLNANPYDNELLQMNSFHAVLFKEVIKSGETRTIDGVKYRRLYNPILHFLSEDTKNYGSFYDSRGGRTPTWHCLDQILVSKALVDNIETLKYLKHIKSNSLLARYAPKKND